MISPPLTVADLKAWADFNRRLRSFFETRRFLEVTTDCLVPAGAFESQIDPFSVSPGELQLHTSPEFEMKRVLSRLAVPIYQICKCFRDDPPTPVHRREFTMLEFYRPGVDYRVTQQDMCELLPWACDRPLQIQKISVCALVEKHTGIDLAGCLEAELLRAEVEARRLVLLSADDAWDDMFFKLMIEKIEPAIDPLVPLLVYDYPPALSALAARDPRTGWAQRFEIYWHGMELCNGCTELEDATELRARFEAEKHARLAKGKAPHPFPEALFEAVSSAAPGPKSGVAVGLDRLFACVQAVRLP